MSSDVPTPKDFSLPYTDLTFTTPDGIRLKSYLLMQRPELHVHGATHIEWDADTDEEGEKEAVSEFSFSVVREKSQCIGFY